jgi:hypothetical protein
MEGKIFSTLGNARAGGEEKKIKEKGLLLICLVVLILGSTIVVNVRSNPGTPNVYVDPPTKIDIGLNPGSSFTVTIKISNVERMWAFSAFLRWGTPILNVTDDTKVTQVGQFLEAGGTVSKIIKVYPDEGKLFVMAALSGEEAEPQTGDGILFTVEFLVEGWGASPIDLYETKVQVRPEIGQPYPVEHTAEDGFFSNITPADYEVAVTNVTSSKTVVCIGYTTYINVTLKNDGTATTAFAVTAYYNSSSIGFGQMVTLASGASTTTTITWDTTDVAKGIYTISAAAYILPNETNTDDNTYVDGTVRVTMVGDVSAAFDEVDIVDIVYVAISFGSKKGEPEYNPNADVDNNGEIDIVDIVIIAIHFGEKDP